VRLVDHQHYEATHFCLFAGAGGLSLGLSQGCARVGQASMRMRCLGGVDVWPAAMATYSRLTGSPGTVLDLFDRTDFEAFHGRPPPAGWREATPADIRAAAGGECPDILATSPPCKGFSGLLNAAAAGSEKYAALNRLTVRGLALALEAFADDPPSLVVLENVPRIQTRGRELLDTICALLRAHGYAVAETVHDCGELGGLAQHRRRFLLVARHAAKVRPFLYEPPRRRVRGIGEVLGELPMPEDERAGPMHRLPRLTWQTWLRLALIEAGKDWRSLHELAVVDGYLRDVGVAPLGADWHAGVLGVRSWTTPSPTVTSRSGPSNGAYAVADPRTAGHGRYQPYGVVRWDEASRTVTGQAAPGAGPYSVSDPRLRCDVDDRHGRRHNNVYRLLRFDEPSQAVTAGTGPSGGGLSVADPRGLRLGEHSGKMAVQSYCAPARTVTGTVDVQAGAQCIADPRPGWAKSDTGDWSTSGHYGVRTWAEASGAVTAQAKLDRGAWSVADPRVLPAANDRPDPVPLIVALDSTWHRPLTTMELAALQGYPVFDADGQPLEFDGGSDAARREQIGNSVPVGAARALGDEMARTLLLEALGESFQLSATPVWVHPYVAAVAATQVRA
jgi:site-specific DNA-cytosine methylase